ncbi:MAG: SCO6745 family protein [Acidimicrobiales bacterium]
MTPEELVTQACPAIGNMGWAFYFVPETLAKGKELGLDGLRFYFLGRGGVLGDVEACVIASAFGYFKPDLVGKMWDSARQTMGPRQAARAYLECCAEFGRSHFSAVEELDAFCDAAEAVRRAADPTGLSLYAGYVDEPLADDLPARAMQLVTVLREFRGSAHLLAIRAVGLSAKTAHYIHRPGDVAMFGYGAADEPTITDAEVSLLAAAKDLTDRLVLPAYAVLDNAGQQALTVGLARLEGALAPGA